MLYSIKANIQTKNSEHPFSTTIIEGNKTQLFVDIPYFEGKKVTFEKGEELELTYYIGQFQYLFTCSFVEENIKHIYEVIKEESDESPRSVLKESVPYLDLSITNVRILKNLRKEKRELIEVDAVIMDSKGIFYGKILDISEKGVRFRTTAPLNKKSVVLHYVDEADNSVKAKGKVVWHKAGEDFHYYGFRKK